MTADAKKFYLCTPMERHEFMRMPIELIPPEFAQAYNLSEKVQNGYVYMRIVRGMYGLPQAGMLANNLLKERLEKHGYIELTHTPGLFMHKTRPVWFTLVVDDFGVKYVGEENAKHLMSVLREFYEVEEDWNGGLYCGITLEWNYKRRYVDIAMPNYVQKQLLKYKWRTPKRPQYCPYSPAPVNYGKKSDIIIDKPESPKLDKAGKKYIQQVVGSFLYYARAVDMTILHALSKIVSEQADPTEKTKN